MVNIPVPRALVRRPQQQPGQPGADGEPPPQPPQQQPSGRQRPPTPGQLRRERRALVRAREDRIRDLGGLLLEMYKREHFREDLYLEQCAEIVSMEDRIRDVDERLAMATRQTMTDADRCACGAPLVWGAHFCANCGRPVGEQAVVACANCGSPLPADASFCPSCGRPAEPAESQAAGGSEDTAQVSPQADTQGR
jgi:double zinc ribbon protein